LLKFSTISGLLWTVFPWQRFFADRHNDSAGFLAPFIDLTVSVVNDLGYPRDLSV